MAIATSRAVRLLKIAHIIKSVRSIPPAHGTNPTARAFSFIHQANQASQSRRKLMKRIALSFFAVALLTAPALAGSPVAADKPMVVAEGADVNVGGVRLEVGDRDRHRDGDWRRRHRDRDRDIVVIKPRHRDRDRDRDHHGERAHD